MGKKTVNKPTQAQRHKPANRGYGDAGASATKKALKGFNATSGSAREDIDIHNATLRQRARMLYMAAPVATSAIRTNRTNVIGSGLKLKSRIDRERLGLSAEQAKEWQRKTEAEFRLWADNKRTCDATGVNNFASLQQLALVSWLLSGDCHVLIKHMQPTPLYPYGLRLQLIEADRIATPTALATGITYFCRATEGRMPNGNKIYDGVEVDGSGAIVAYHIRSKYPYEVTADANEWQRVLAYGEQTGLPNILQIMDTERPDQYRGVTYLAQVIEPLLQIRRYTEAELTAAVIESFFTTFVTTTASPETMPWNEINTEAEQGSDDPNEYEMGPGQINIMKPGEGVTFADPKRPTGGFDVFVQSICKQVGAALEIPADLLTKAFTSSYSASRAALLEAWKAFRMRREWFVDDFCKPVYAVWLSEAVARGRVKAPGFFSDPAIRAAWLGSEWIGPSQGQLDPVKEITAEQLACANGFSTREQSTIRLNGGQYEANAEQLARENELLSKAASTAEPSRTETETEGNNNEQNETSDE